MRVYCPVNSPGSEGTLTATWQGIEPCGDSEQYCYYPPSKSPSGAPSPSPLTSSPSKAPTTSPTTRNQLCCTLLVFPFEDLRAVLRLHLRTVLRLPLPQVKQKYLVMLYGTYHSFRVEALRRVLHLHLPQVKQQ